MAKSDKSKHSICIASIKRHTIKPYDFKWTKFYESNSEFSYSYLPLNLSETELIICSSVMDSENYSVLTTQRLITKQNGQESFGIISEETSDKDYGDFKGYKDKDFTLGGIQLQDGTELKYFVETGNASMVMIYGVRTLLRIQRESE
jgi:hypothetical protein